MGLISLVIAFEYTFFFMLQVVVGSDERGAGMQAFNIVVFVLAMNKAMGSIMRNNTKRTWQIIIGMAGFLVLYLLTGAMNGFGERQYQSYLLAFGVRCVPGVFCAIALANNQRYFMQMQKWLQVFVILYAIGVSIAVFTATGSNQLNDKFTVGVNYQELSYCAAFAFNIDLYIVMFWDDIHKFRFFRSSFWRWIDIALLFLLLYCMMSGGGRGAILDIIAVTVFLIYVKRGFKLNFRVIIGAIIFITVVFIGVYIFADKTGNAGAQRLVRFFIEREDFVLDRRAMLRESALKAFSNNPILGNGIGSIFHVAGFYSHNIFTDILAEGGVIMITIVALMLLNILRSIKALIEDNHGNVLIYVIFLSSFVNLLFSGYYLGEGGIWFSVAYILISFDNIGMRKRNMRMRELQGGLG